MGILLRLKTYRCGSSTAGSYPYHQTSFGSSWNKFFEDLQQQHNDLLTALKAHDLLDSDHVDQVSRMRRSAEGRSVPISGIHHVDDDTVTLLAAGFSRGEATKPAIPYVRVEN